METLTMVPREARIISDAYAEKPLFEYHSRALQLVDVTPKPAPNANSALEAVEKRIRRALPPSLREWYSLEGACGLLTSYSNHDPAVPIEDLGMDPLIDRDFLLFRNENQGVCRWAVWLNGSDDPPVFVDYDGAFETYKPCANSFSDYVYTNFWDWGRVLNREQALIQAQNQPISDEALMFLRENFTSELQTSGWPGDHQYRFSSSDQRILVWASSDQADWWLVGDTEDALDRLVRRLGNIDSLRGSLWSNDPVGEAILQRLRTDE
jgi:hypothetical protein